MKIPRFISTAFLLLILCFSFFSLVYGQSTDEPTNRQCKLWDDAFLATFEVGVILTLIAASAIGLLSTSLGVRFWPFTRPNFRIWLVVVTVALIALIAFVGLPYLWPGALWYAGIDPLYSQCPGKPFGATGFFDGSIGKDVAAIAQPMTMVALVIGASILGGIIANAISLVINYAKKHRIATRA